MKILKRILLSFFIFLCWASILMCIGAYIFLTTTWGARMAASYLIKYYITSGHVEVGSYKGTIEKGLLLKDVTITEIPNVKDGRIIMKEVYVQVPLIHWDRTFLKVVNGRLEFPSEDSIIFNGTMMQNQIKGNCYVHGADVHQIVSALGYPDLAKYLYGFLSHIDLSFQGPVGALRFTGRLFVDKITYRYTTVRDGFGRLDLTIKSLGNMPSMNGFVLLDSAIVKVDKINIDLTASKVIFNGDVSNFILDIHGVSKVEDITIDMAIKGTFQKPHLIFNSDPPMPEDKILMILATGKSWSEIASDRSQAFGLRKKLTDAFNVGMEVEERTTQPGRTQPLGYSRTIEGQMNVTDKLSVNVAKKFYPNDTAAPSSTSTTPSSGKNNDTEVYLQYKQRF